MKTFISILLAVLLVPSVGASQDCIEYEEYNTQIAIMDIPGAWDVEVSGSYAYITTYNSGEPNSGLCVVSIKDPQSPIIVGSVAWQGDVYKLTVSGSFAYVADGQYGLKVINVADPANPYISAEFDTPGDARSVTVAGDLVLVADRENGLLIYNVASPYEASPSQYPIVGYVDTPGMAVDVTVAGSIAYVADSYSGLQVVDISVPESPQIVGVVDTIGYISCVRVVDGYAYVAGHDMHVLDISEPEAPNPVGSIELSGEANDLAFSEQFVFIVGGQSCMVDISDFAHPELVASLRGVGSYGVAASGTHAFYAGYSERQFSGVISFDFSSLDVPASIGFLSGDLFPVFDLVVSDSYAYVAQDGYLFFPGGFFVIDVSNPSSPYLAGTTYIGVLERIRDVAVLGNYAYVAGFGSTAGCAGLNIVDVTNPASPFAIASLQEVPPWMLGVDVSGSFAYLVGYGFYVVDISNPAIPQVVWEDHNTSGRAIDVSEPYAYVGGYDGGLQVFDISEPANPQVVGTVATPGATYDVEVAGPYAYIASGGLQVIDISDAQNPQVVGSIVVPAERVAINGSYAYVTGGIGLTVIDISNPENPQYVGDVPGASAVDVSGALVYCADVNFMIYPVQCADGVASVDGSVLGDDIPSTESRFAVYPNPFNPQATVEYSLSRTEWADISVYDLTGRQVTTLASRIFTAGPHTLTWNGRDTQGRAMPSGTYIIRLEAESGVEARKVMLLR